MCQFCRSHGDCAGLGRAFLSKEGAGTAVMGKLEPKSIAAAQATTLMGSHSREAKPVAFWGGLGLEGQGRREEAGMQGGSGCGEQEQAAQAISTVWFLGRKKSN